MSTLEGNWNLESGRVAIVVARFNQMITENLLAGATACLEKNGVTSDRTTTTWVPGAFEIPMAANELAKTGKFDAIIALGCVIRGGTPHFDYVCNEVSAGCTRVQLDHGIPLAFGVLTTDNYEQAQDRAGGKEGNKGFEAAQVALEMTNLVNSIRTLE